MKSYHIEFYDECHNMDTIFTVSIGDIEVGASVIGLTRVAFIYGEIYYLTHRSHLERVESFQQAWKFTG